MKEELVSIIVPVYNAEKFLKSTIETVTSQNYSNWELIFVDDCSKDNSVKIIEEYISKDGRIKLLKQKENLGAALARNFGIENAHGRYICFLDADDRWVENKIRGQISFMRKNKCAFSFTGYQFADKECVPNGAIVKVPKTITYRQALKNTTISTITVMFYLKSISKEEIYMPNIKSEDTATWWRILRSGVIAYGTNDVMSYYRRTEGTLSSNKLEAIKRIWYLYRKVEKLNIFYSMYNFVFYAINAVRRRI